MSKNIKEKQPLKFKLLKVNSLRRDNEVKSRDIYEQNSTVFKKDGLFSTEIFGEVGSVERMQRFGFIDLHLDVMHPLVYRYVKGLSSLYKGILEGTLYAIYNSETDMFEAATKESGKTGIRFFMKHYDTVKFPDTGSDERSHILKFLYSLKRSDVLLNRWAVLPAGMRDYTVTKSGKPLEDEINNLYRKLLTTARVSKELSGIEDAEFLNTILVRLENNILDIYEYIENIYEGKKGFAQGKWVSRRVAYGSRNVFTASPIQISDLKSEHIPTVSDTIIGIFQYIKTILPIAIFYIRSGFTDQIFSTESSNAYLVNPKTLEKEIVTLSEKERSLWVTDEGLEKNINKLIDDTFKTSPIVIDGYYLMLIYDDGKHLILLDDIRSLPADRDKKYVRPITYIEFYYIAIYPTLGRYHGFTTRYPIDGLGSIYPTVSYVKTTIKGREVTIDGLYPEPDKKLYEYPILGSNFFNSMSPHGTKLATLSADFDGDKGNFSAVWTEESNKDIDKLLNSRAFYISIDNKVNYSSSDQISELTIDFLTE